MKEGRRGHGVIFDASQFLVIGGSGKLKTENCVLNEETVNCTEQSLGLTNYEFYPELALVDGNDCSLLK